MCMKWEDFGQLQMHQQCTSWPSASFHGVGRSRTLFPAYVRHHVHEMQPKKAWIVARRIHLILCLVLLLPLATNGLNIQLVPERRCDLQRERAITSRW